MERILNNSFESLNNIDTCTHSPAWKVSSEWLCLQEMNLKLENKESAKIFIWKGYLTRTYFAERASFQNLVEWVACKDFIRKIIKASLLIAIHDEAWFSRGRKILARRSQEIFQPNIKQLVKISSSYIIIRGAARFFDSRYIAIQAFDSQASIFDSIYSRPSLSENSLSENPRWDRVREKPKILHRRCYTNSKNSVSESESNSQLLKNIFNDKVEQ